MPVRTKSVRTKSVRASLLAAPLLLAAPVFLTGCTTVGPDYHGAPVAAPTAAARGAFLRGDATTPAQQPAASWWTALGDPVLDDLVASGLRASPTMAAAQARIDAARATLAATRSAQLPTVGVGAVAAEVSLPGGPFGADGRISKQVYGDNFDASWELDLFGGTRRKIDASEARAQAAEASAADAAVSLSAEIVRTYVDMRVQQASAALLDRQVECDRTLLGHAQQRFAQGTVPAQTVDQARSALAQSESDAAATRGQITVLADQLAVLAGREPGALDALAASPAPIPALPAQIAVGDPARLLRNRPDIRVAERQIAAANADLGARIADRFPTVSFTGLLGMGGTSVGDAFSPSSLIGLVLPQIKWNLFDGGRAAAQERAARGNLAEAEANYRARVLSALEDAEASLARFGTARIAYAKALEARDATDHLARLQAQRANGGTISQADALSAARQALRAQLGAVSAQATLASDFVAVQKALGLGWEPREAQK